MLKSLVEYTIQQLVDMPERLSVVETHDNDTIIFHVTVDAGDRGKVIGKDGYTIKALRAFLSLIAPKNTRVIIDLIQAA